MTEEKTIAPEDIHYNTVMKENFMEMTSKDPDIAKRVKVVIRFFDENIADAIADVQHKMSNDPEYRAYVDSLVPDRFKR